MVGEFEFTNDHFLKEELAGGQVLLKEGQNRLGNKLHLTGPSHDIRDFYRAADIYIHAAILEGLPNAILEAMASGLPVISSRIPGLEDFILLNNTNCMLAEGKEEFIRHIKNLNDDKSLYNKIGDGGRAFVEQNASFGKVLETLEMKL